MIDKLNRKRKKSLPCLSCKKGMTMLNCNCDKLVRFKGGNPNAKDR